MHDRRRQASARVRRTGGSPLLAAALVTALVLSAGCSGPGGTATPTPSTSSPASATTHEYLPGVQADVHLPGVAGGAGAVPVVLLVPGGGWETADRSGFAPLAEEMARAGFVVVNATYRAGADGVGFPVPVQDVLCASGFAVDAARSAGVEPGPVVVLGHSAGGHIAALAALEGEGLGGQCPFPVPQVEGLIGLAGVYDATAFPFGLVDFFGGTESEQPEAWRQGDPVGLVDSGGVPDGLQVLLLHGDADDVVPIEQSRAFESSLRRAGAPVSLEVVPGATHATIYTAEVAAPLAVRWITDLAAGRSPH